MNDRNKTKEQLLKKLQEIRLKLKNSAKKTNSPYEQRDSNQIFYQNIVDNFPVLICCFLPKTGTITFVNKEYCKYFNKKKEDLIGHSFLELIPHTEHKKVKSQFNSLTKKKPFVSYEHLVNTPQGTRWQQWTDQALFNKSGKLIEYQSIGKDITEQKKIKETLAFEKERFYSALNNINALVVIEDEKFNILFENTHLKKSFGNHTGKKCYKSYLFGEKPCKVCPIKEILHGNKTEFTYYPEINGKIFESHAAKFKTSDGKSCIIEILTDITKRKQEEETLKKFSNAVENAYDTIIFTDLNGNITYTNKAASKTFGYTFDEFTKMNVVKLNYDTNIINKIHKTAIKEGHWEGEVINVRKNKNKFSGLLSVSIVTDKQGNSLGLMGIFRDIDKRKQREKTLRENEKKYRQLFDNETDALVIFDAKTLKFEDVNQAALDLFGYTKEEFLQLKVNDISAEKEKTENTIKKVKQNGPIRINLRYKIKKDGTIFPVEISPGVFFWKGRKKIIGAIRDITERQKAQEDLKKSSAKLAEQKNVLDKKNTALRELLEQIELEKKKIRNDVYTNIEKLVLPLLEKLKIEKGASEYITLIKNNLTQISSSFGNKITDKMLSLTPREIEICNMIKNGLSSKEMSKTLSLSFATVEAHRRNIRKKLGVVNRSINLPNYLNIL